MEIKPDWIETFTGEKIWLPPQAQKKNHYRIDDIAHSLAMQCRFSGHTRYHYSVAQHSILVTNLVPEAYKPFALLHDATEAYFVDVPSPIKQMLPDYKIIEKKLQVDIFKAFGLGPEIPEVVKHADSAMLAREAQLLMFSRGSKWHSITVAAANMGITRLSIEAVERMFLSLAKVVLKGGD